jgi:hypothetical protein
MLSRLTLIAKNKLIYPAFLRPLKIYSCSPVYYFAKIGKKKQEKMDKKIEKQNLNLDKVIDISDAKNNFASYINDIKVSS